MYHMIYIYIYITIHINILKYTFILYIYILYTYRVKAGGSPELPGTLSLVMYYKRCYVIEMGGGAGGGWGNNVMWSALD